MTDTIANQPVSKCLFIIAEKGKYDVKDHLKQFGAVYNGAGWYVEDKYRGEVEQICDQANMRHLDFPLNDETFSDLKRRHKLAFFQEKAIKLRLRIDSLKATLGISTLNLHDLLHGEQRSDIERTNEGRQLTEAAAEHDRFQEQIKRIEEEERIANITVNSTSRFQYLLETCSEQKVSEEIKNTSPGISVGYKIGDIDLKIPGGALSIAALPTGQGKTATLINFTLGALNHQHDKSVIFFTYEENASSILTLFLNTYIGQMLSKNNRESIRSHFRDDTLKYFDTEKRDTFTTRKREFFENIVDTGRLMVHYTEMSANELVAAIHFLKKNTNVGLICIDYMQLLKMLNGPQGRQEQLKEICIMLKDCAVATGLPILLGAQFNRTVVAEADLSPTAIGEAGDIERVASLIIGGWNRTFEGFSREGNITKEKKSIAKDSSIYLEVLKGRGIGHGHASVFDFDGNTGKLSNRISEHRPSNGQASPKPSQARNPTKEFLEGRQK